MQAFDQNQFLALLGVLLAAVALPASDTVVVLAFVIGMLAGDKLRDGRP